MNNPLLKQSGLPNQAPPFDLIREEHYLPAIEQAIETAHKNIALIKENPAAPDFENTIAALEFASDDLGIATSVFYNQLSANGTDSLHALAGKIGPISSNFSSDILHDADLFAKVRAVHEKADTLHLTVEQRMLLDETYSGFVRGGALLDTEKKQRLREISERLSVLNPTYMNNVKKYAEEFELIIDDESALSGVPETAKIGAREAAKEKGHEGKWLFNLDMPSYLPLIQYADDRALREKIWRGYNGQAFGGTYDNCGTLLEIVRLRHERANLLGYQTHAHYVLERRMAERPETVMDFLEQLKNSYRPAAEKDLKTLQDFAATLGGAAPLAPWDVAYYSEKLKQKLFDFSSEDFRPYFPLDRVIEGCFAHFAQLFNLQFKPAQGYQTWHKDVKVYEVFDKTDGEFLGTLFADFYPRTGKSSGAWKTSYRDQGLFNGKLERPVIAIVTNFTKPAADKPSLLTHDEVQTLFHEMGHAMHAMCSRTTYRSLAGTNVLWDFVELPSQIQENWSYTKQTLDLFAAHYETGEKIPAVLIEKLNKARNYMVGWAGLRQTGLALLDMAWHTQDPSGITDVAAFEDKATAQTSLFPRLAGPMSTHFGHIFAGGYSAGYYSYKWAEVLDADAFELFQERGLYDRPTAEAFKNEVLAKGGSEHPTVLYRRFRGRDADPAALFRREGLFEKAA